MAGQEDAEFSEQVPVFEEARIPSGPPALPQTEPFMAGKPVPALQPSKPPAATKAPAPNHHGHLRPMQKNLQIHQL